MIYNEFKIQSNLHIQSGKMNQTPLGDSD